MIGLTIGFNAVSGAESYNICYRQVGTLDYTCISVSSNTAVITDGIICGINYEGYVEAVCDVVGGLVGGKVFFTTTGAACEGGGTPTPACVSYTVSTSAASGQGYSYIDCDGVLVEGGNVGGGSGYDAQTFCAQANSVSLIGSELFLTDNGACTDIVINVISVYGFMEPCQGGTMDDHMGAAIALSGPVSVDTIFDVNVYYVFDGNTCGNNNQSQSFSITVAAGQDQGNIDACSRGSYFQNGANVCYADVSSHDNTVDTIDIFIPA